MAKTEKEVWEYPTLTGVICQLSKKFPLHQERRHTAIGLGVLLGVKEIYEKQNQPGKKGYWSNAILDQAEEAGFVAESIKSLAQDPEQLKQCSQTLSEGQVKLDIGQHPWSRPYGVLMSNNCISPGSLTGLGEYLERRFHSRSNQRDFARFREAAGRLMKENEGEYQKKKGQLLLAEQNKLTRYLIEYAQQGRP